MLSLQENHPVRRRCSSFRIGLPRAFRTAKFLKNCRTEAADDRWRSRAGPQRQNDPTLKKSRSLETMDASSVICAPIRSGENVLGLIHLYSLGTERSFNTDELEFTLAIADEVAPLLKSLQHRDELSESFDRVAEKLRHCGCSRGDEIVGGEPMRSQPEVARSLEPTIDRTDPR